MTQVNIHEAKTHFSRLVERAEAGEEIVVARAGKPVARLVPYEETPRPSLWGVWRGKVWMADDFDDTPEDVLRAFEGE